MQKYIMLRGDYRLVQLRISTEQQSAVNIPNSFDNAFDRDYIRIAALLRTEIINLCTSEAGGRAGRRWPRVRLPARPAAVSWQTPYCFICVESVVWWRF